MTVAGPAPPDASQEWQRLHPRMLLVHPVREVVKFLPVLAGVVVAGAATDRMGPWWQLLGVAVPVLLGLARYLTTSFRVTADRVELRRGLLERHALSTRIERVRTVDLTASPVQRVLGLTTVRIGTGTASTSDEDSLDLDGLTLQDAHTLRSLLLPSGGRAADGPDVGTAPHREVLRLDPAWVRFAPLTSSGVVLGAAVLGVVAQAMEVLGSGVEVELRSTALSWWLLPLALLGLAVVVSALAIAGYLVTNWGFTLTRAGGSWHLRRGLLTTRETTLGQERLAGVVVGEPLGLRLARGGRLAAIVTGLDPGERGSSVLVPPAPRDVVTAVASEVLSTAGPVTGRLVGHGARARTRRFTRALAPAVLVSLLLTTGILLAGASAWWLATALVPPAVGVLLAADRSRSLGHALVDGFVVTRHGSLYRRRAALAEEHVIGWAFRTTWFQRRAGLTSLVATTAGGRQSITLLDLPEDRAVELADRAVPGLVEQFVTCR